MDALYWENLLAEEGLSPISPNYHPALDWQLEKLTEPPKYSGSPEPEDWDELAYTASFLPAHYRSLLYLTTLFTVTDLARQLGIQQSTLWRQVDVGQRRLQDLHGLILKTPGSTTEDDFLDLLCDLPNHLYMPVSAYLHHGNSNEGARALGVGRHYFSLRIEEYLARKPKGNIAEAVRLLRDKHVHLHGVNHPDLSLYDIPEPWSFDWKDVSPWS